MANPQLSENVQMLLNKRMSLEEVKKVLRIQGYEEQEVAEVLSTAKVPPPVQPSSNMGATEMYLSKMTPRFSDGPKKRHTGMYILIVLLLCIVATELYLYINKVEIMSVVPTNMPQTVQEFLYSNFFITFDHK